jgi:hypothetical protein
VLTTTIEQEEKRKAADSGVAGKGSRWRMLADPKLMLFLMER